MDQVWKKPVIFEKEMLLTINFQNLTRPDLKETGSF